MQSSHHSDGTASIWHESSGAELTRGTSRAGSDSMTVLSFTRPSACPPPGVALVPDHPAEPAFSLSPLSAARHSKSQTAPREWTRGSLRESQECYYSLCTCCVYPIPLEFLCWYNYMFQYFRMFDVYIHHIWAIYTCKKEYICKKHILHKILATLLSVFII